MIAGGNWWRANEIVIRHLTRKPRRATVVVTEPRHRIDINRTFPLSHFFLAAALANLGKLDEAQAETRVGLTLDPTFTIQRFRVQESDNPIFLAGREHIVKGMRKAGVPEGGAKAN
jgi:hypothetical protein